MIGRSAQDVVAHPDGSGRLGIFLPYDLAVSWGIPTQKNPPKHYVYRDGLAGAGFVNAITQAPWPDGAKEKFLGWLSAQEFDIQRPIEGVRLSDRRGLAFFYHRDAVTS
jgi:hypothetical protein